MSIRHATMDDLPTIIALGEQMHAESPRWSRLTFNRAKAADMLAQLILKPWGVIFVAEKDGEIIGGIAGMVSAHWSSDDLIADEVSFFMASGYRGDMAAPRLIRALRVWGEGTGAKWLDAGTSTGVEPERCAQLYERLGFTRCAIGLEVDYGV